MTHRKIQALRNLAERPGTPEEGRTASAMLDAVLAKAATDPDAYADLREIFRRHGLDREAERVGKPHQCACGKTYPYEGSQCFDAASHTAIHMEIRHKFPKGTRVFYNYWAYEMNCTATVTGYVDDPNIWNWISLKFDHLKSGYRKVSIYSAKGWHLSTERVSQAEHARLYRP